MNMQIDPVLTYYQAILAKENEFLAVVDEFLQDMEAFLQQEGRADDPKVVMLKKAYNAATQCAGRLYQILKLTLSGLHSPLRPDMEQRLPPIGHEARQSALYLLGCHSCLRLSPRACFFAILDKERKARLDFLLDLMQAGELTQDALWDETQSLLQLESIVPVAQRDDGEEKALKRRNQMVVPFAFAAGNILRDKGIDFLKEILGEVGL